MSVSRAKLGCTLVSSSSRPYIATYTCFLKCKNAFLSRTLLLRFKFRGDFDARCVVFPIAIHMNGVGLSVASPLPRKSLLQCWRRRRFLLLFPSFSSSFFFSFSFRADITVKGQARKGRRRKKAQQGGRGLRKQIFFRTCK